MAGEVGKYMVNVDVGVKFDGEYFRALEKFDASREAVEATEEFKKGFIVRVEETPPEKNDAAEPAQ